MRVLALAVLLLAAAGCVSQDRFRKKEAEAAKLDRDLREEGARRTALEARLASADAEVVRLGGEVSALREKTRSDEGTLAAKEAELRAAREKHLELEALVEELSRSKKRLEAAKAELEKKSAEYERLAGALRSEIDAGRVELTELRGRMTVKMKDKILFSSGSATLGKDGKAALQVVADALKGVSGKVIRVEGHTDDVPTASGAFASNWELSVARALAVVRYLQEMGVDPTRLAAAGYGEYQPIAPNDSADGRGQNRRIDIVLAPLEGAVAAPPKM
jgi:chemotaxis protein MotB